MNCSPLIRMLAGSAFVFMAVGILALFTPDILPFAVVKDVAIALIAVGMAFELGSAVLLIKAQRRHGRERLQRVVQEAKKHDKP